MQILIYEAIQSTPLWVDVIFLCLSGMSAVALFYSAAKQLWLAVGGAAVCAAPDTEIPEYIREMAEAVSRTAIKAFLRRLTAWIAVTAIHVFMALLF